MGYNVPQKIVSTAELAKRFGHQAKLLEQIANFHNTIGDRMITSQRPMMLEAAFGLATLVKDQSGMTWNNTKEVDKYIIRLKQHVDKLARQNNKLATHHKGVKAKVLELMNTDLLRKQVGPIFTILIASLGRYQHLNCCNELRRQAMHRQDTIMTSKKVMIISLVLENSGISQCLPALLVVHDLCSSELLLLLLLLWGWWWWW